MTPIIKKKLEKERVNPLERHNFLSKDDAKTTFTYGLVAFGVLVAFYGVTKSFLKQIHKD
jgi:hypothetical protein